MWYVPSFSKYNHRNRTLTYLADTSDWPDPRYRRSLTGAKRMSLLAMEESGVHRDMGLLLIPMLLLFPLVTLRLGLVRLAPTLFEAFDRFCKPFDKYFINIIFGSLLLIPIESINRHYLQLHATRYWWLRSFGDGFDPGQPPDVFTRYDFKNRAIFKDEWQRRVKEFEDRYRSRFFVLFLVKWLGWGRSGRLVSRKTNDRASSDLELDAVPDSEERLMLLASEYDEVT